MKRSIGFSANLAAGPAVSFLTGCQSMVYKMAGLNQSKPLSSEELAGMQKIEVACFTHSAVMTEKRDWGGTVLQVLITAGGGVAGGMAAGAGAVAAAAGVTGTVAGSTASGLLTGGTGRDDSAVFSATLQKNLGDWRLMDIFTQKAHAALASRTSLQVEVTDLFKQDLTEEEKKLYQESLIIGSPMSRQTMQEIEANRARLNPTTKRIDAFLMLMFMGKGSPKLTMTMSWTPRRGADGQAAAPVPLSDKNTSFDVVDTSAAGGHAYMDEYKRSRIYMYDSPGHDREKWTSDNCAVLKQEIERGLDELCARMTADIFPQQKAK